LFYGALFFILHSLLKGSFIMTAVSPSNPIKVVYIMGSNRSGSTLLEHIFHDHPDIIGVGELTRLVPVASSQNNARLRDSSFWQAVMEQWLAHPSVHDLTTYGHLQQQFEPYHCLPRLLREQQRPSPEFQRYMTQTRALFAAIQQVSGTSIIVDSSKVPVRALILGLIPGIDLRVVHLVRDGRGVAWSLKKSYDRSMFRSENIQTLFSSQRSFFQNIKASVIRYDRRAYIWLGFRLWVLSNLVSNWVREQLGTQRAMLCRYEDMIIHSEQVLNKISAFINVDLGQTTEKLTHGVPLAPSCAFAGNEKILQEQVVHLRLDTRWIEQFPPVDRLIFYLLTGWLMRKYGYSNRVVTDSPTQVVS
jgi:hypothetical protein